MTFDFAELRRRKFDLVLARLDAQDTEQHALSDMTYRGLHNAGNDRF